MRLNAVAAVLAVNAALAGALAFMWSDADRTRWAEPAALPPSIEDPAVAPAAEPIDVSRYRETVERPLFASTRRPGPRKDPAAEAEAAVDSLKEVRLLGTYGAGDKGGIVVVSGGKVQRVAVGERIAGWQVVGGGEGRRAELVRANGERRQLELALNNAAPAAAAAAGKAGDQEAGAEAARPSAGVQAGTARGPAAAARGATSRIRSMSPEQERQLRLERRNERRAARGLPPLPASN